MVGDVCLAEVIEDYFLDCKEYLLSWRDLRSDGFGGTSGVAANQSAKPSQSFIALSVAFGVFRRPEADPVCRCCWRRSHRGRHGVPGCTEFRRGEILRRRRMLVSGMVGVEWWRVRRDSGGFTLRNSVQTGTTPAASFRPDMRSVACGVMKRRERGS